MAFLWALVVVSTLHGIEGNSCTDLTQIPYLLPHVEVLREPVLKLSSPGPMKCAGQCSRRRFCKSFNYNIADKECLLFDVDSSHESFVTICNQDFFFANMSAWPKSLLGVCGSHDCEMNEICTEDTLTSSSCILLGVPSTCNDLQQCNGHLPDGEYWLYLKAFSGKRVRVYCHLMNTPNPVHYLTLVQNNSGLYPNERKIDCVDNVPMGHQQKQYVGTRVFEKIQIDLQNLKVVTNDVEFASGTETPLPYAVAADCWTEHLSNRYPASCGTKGTFHVDLTGTGFIVSPLAEWERIGNYPFMKVEKISPSKIDLFCGGWCGGCQPKGDLYLQPSNETLPEASAKDVYCPLNVPAVPPTTTETIV